MNGIGAHTGQTYIQTFIFIYIDLLQGDVKHSVMPPPIFTTVPSLPMFLVETNENRPTSQSEKPESLHFQSTSDGAAGEIESGTQQRLPRKVQQISVLLTFICSLSTSKTFS
jgi:hypothetical protein